MTKTTITPEQSATLIARGISAERASMVCMNFNGTYAYVCGGEAQTVRDCVNSKFYVEESRVFTLTDILSLLPKHIPFANAEWYLNIQWDILDNKWHVQYLDFDHYDEVVKEEEAPELIDALYLLALAVINHVKLD